jgi:hypothetical protein
MRANIDSSVEIEEENRHAYHLRMEKVAVNPNDPLHPIVRVLIRVFRPIDYKKYFECSARDQAEYLKTMNFQNAELVHDPSKETIEVVERPKSAEEEFVIAKKTGEAIKTPAERRKPSKKVTK